MSTNNTRTSEISAGEFLDAAATFVAGGGLLTMVLFPLALPMIILVVVPLIALGLVAVAAGVIIVAVAGTPLLLVRRARSLVGGARPSRHRRTRAPAPSTHHLPAVTK